MGAWGTALYSDDLAADLRRDFRDLIGDGLSAEAALERLKGEYESSFSDQDEEPVCWLAIADTAWKLGRPSSRATAEALRVIETGADLRRWQSPKDREKRCAILQKLAETLRSPAPHPKRVVRPFRANNQWKVGEVIAFRLPSGRWTSFRVIGHHTDKGGRSAICELLDWIGSAPPQERDVRGTSLRQPSGALHISQFLVGEPRRKLDAERFARTGILSKPRQVPGGFAVFVFPHFDRQLQEVFDID